MTTPERTAQLLAAILHELAQPHGPTENRDVVVHESWTKGDEVFVVYSAPWFNGRLGYRQRLTGYDEDDVAEDIAHFQIAEPLGRLRLVLDPPDDQGVTWWDDETMSRLKPPRWFRR